MTRRAVAAAIVLLLAAAGTADGAPVKRLSASTALAETSMNTWGGGGNFWDIEIQSWILTSGSQRARTRCISGRRVELVKGGDQSTPFATAYTDGAGRFSISGFVGPPADVQVSLPEVTRTFRVREKRFKVTCGSVLGPPHRPPVILGKP